MRYQSDKLRREQDAYHVKLLISRIHRMWRKGPDAPPKPAIKAGGIRDRAISAARGASRGADRQ
jgi:hypothetical protein